MHRDVAGPAREPLVADDWEPPRDRDALRSRAGHMDRKNDRRDRIRFASRRSVSVQLRKLLGLRDPSATLGKSAALDLPLSGSR